MTTVRRESAGQMRRRFGRQKGQCTYCGGAVPKGRLSWCGNACVERFRVENDPGYVSRLVYQRDRGVCAQCGLDTVEAHRLVKSVVETVRRLRGCLWYGNELRRRELLDSLGPYPPWGKRSAQKRWFVRRKLLCRCIACLLDEAGLTDWQSDHIVPVAEGGGQCGLSGYQTLCTGCHKRATAELVRRLAARRKGGGNDRR